MNSKSYLLACQFLPFISVEKSRILFLWRERIKHREIKKNLRFFKNKKEKEKVYIPVLYIVLVIEMNKEKIRNSLVHLSKLVGDFAKQEKIEYADTNTKRWWITKKYAKRIKHINRLIITELDEWGIYIETSTMAGNPANAFGVKAYDYEYAWLERFEFTDFANILHAKLHILNFLADYFDEIKKHEKRNHFL